MALKLALVGSLSSAAAFAGASVHVPASAVRCNTPTAALDRRAVTGAAFSALFLGAGAAQAESAPIRKANQDAIGVSRVPIPVKGEGNKGAGIPSVQLDICGFEGKTAVIGSNGAEGGSPNGFFDGGETKKKGCPKRAAPKEEPKEEKKEEKKKD